MSNDNSVQGEYANDGQGRRIETREGLLTVFYAYQDTETMFEHSLSGADTDLVYSDGLQSTNVTGYGGPSPHVVYYHPDALGITRLDTNNSNTPTVLFSDSYQPYGQDNSVSGSETYKFTGKPVSATTGLYYFTTTAGVTRGRGRPVSPGPWMATCATPGPRP